MLHFQYISNSFQYELYFSRVQPAILDCLDNIAKDLKIFIKTLLFEISGLRLTSSTVIENYKWIYVMQNLLLSNLNKIYLLLSPDSSLSYHFKGSIQTRAQS